MTKLVLAVVAALCCGCERDLGAKPPAFARIGRAIPAAANASLTQLTRSLSRHGAGTYTYVRTLSLPEGPTFEHTFVVFRDGRPHRRVLVRVPAAPSSEAALDSFVVFDEWDAEVGSHSDGFAALPIEHLLRECRRLFDAGQPLIARTEGMLHCGHSRSKDFITVSAFSPAAMPDDTRLCDYVCSAGGRPMLPDGYVKMDCNTCACELHGSHAGRPVRLDRAQSLSGCRPWQAGFGACTLMYCGAL